MRVQKDIKAVSTLLAVLLILAAAILGGLVSYMWAISPFYATPNNVSLAITSANFPVYHANYFDVTVLNPSYSPSGTNITSIYLNIAGEASLFNVTETDPPLPVSIDSGASTTIRCIFDWSSYAGSNITVNVSPLNGNGGFLKVQPEFVKLGASTYFNATESVEYFNMTVYNDASSAINLTLNSVTIDSDSVLALSITLPRVLNKGESVSFRCFYDWQGHPKPDVVAVTQEGYTAEVQSDVGASVLLQVDSVQFNETNSGQISVTLSSSPESATPVDIANITIVHGNVTDVINGNLSNPPLPYPLDTNSSITLNCAWNWTDESYRNVSISVTAFTNQGFVSQLGTFITPAEVAARIDQTEFDLEDTGHFTVNMTNLPYSLQTINITGIDFNQSPTGTNSGLVAAGEQATFICNFNWSSFVGQNANLTAHITYGVNNSLLLPPFQATVPYFRISNVTFSDFSLGNPYVNVTVGNSGFSKTDANITQIFIQTENATQAIDGTISYPQISPQIPYPIAAGAERTITCPWNWSPYVGKAITVIVQTADGFQASTTLEL